ncbi:histidine--tRNA ligase [Rickettsiales bacterium]|nr:histidine--tRNA ligase [Rickettsiales bacterium]
MEKLKTVKGTHDLLDEDFQIIDKVIGISEEVSRSFNFEKISTPIIESSNLFSKTLGKGSDIVQKEMYTFIDQGKDSITLRPEGTAAVARALINNSLHEKISQKYFYHGPMFRRERPQAGRLRQFHQFGVESFNQDSFFCDLEIIILAKKILKLLGIDKELELQLNTLGTLEERLKYKEKLMTFFFKYENDLSDESKIRLKVNPMRILDSKDLVDKKISNNAPKIIESLNNESLTFYENIKEGLNKVKINFTENSNLVRGLDYYNHTAFEFVNNKKAQNTVLAGGRYNGLVSSLGGKDICGVGWASGIERITMMMKEKKNHNNRKKICIFAMSENLNFELYKILDILKSIRNISFNVINTGSLKKKFTKANKLNSIGCILLADQEFKNNSLIWKDLTTGNQQPIEIEKINQFLSKKYQ